METHELNSVIATLDVARGLHDRYGPMALWFLAHIAKRERLNNPVGREELAHMAAPMTRATAYAILELLEKRKLVYRYQDPMDHKRRPVAITQQGKRILADAVAMRKQGEIQ